MSKILLIGFYGKGNFGDDVLFKVTYNMAKKWQADANITVLCDQYEEDYLPKLIGSEIRIVPYGNREHYDVIIHGGGGTFFDFKRSSWIDYGINIAIKIIGFSNYQKLNTFIRELTDKKSLSADKRYGFGIGVGTYTDSSIKLKYDIPTLLDFDFLALRDSLSIKNLKKLGIKKEAKLGSDLAFLNHFWVPSGVEMIPTVEGKKRIGLVLRDWESDGGHDYLDDAKSVIELLDEKYKLSLFVFDKRADSNIIELSRGYTSYIWDPISVEFDTYCQELANQDVIITSRAHGAMCGAVLGVPSILIEIEPKLETINALLPNTTMLLDPSQFNAASIEIYIDEVLQYSKKDIQKDIKRNKKLVTDSLLLGGVV